MALDRQTFKTRSLTAVFFVLIMAAGIFLHHWLFLLLFSIIHFGCWMEYQKLMGIIHPSYQEITPVHKYGMAAAGWCFMLWMCNQHFSIGGFTMHAAGLYGGLLLLIVLPVAEFLFAKNIEGRRMLISWGGLVYISLPMGLLMAMRTAFNTDYSPDVETVADLENGLKLSVCVIVSIWINDTMAYLVGSFLGRRPLSRISPKKTWEGTIGGMLLAVVVTGLLFTHLLFKNTGSYPPVLWYSVAAVSAVAGTFGDLFESKLKRLAGVKDSGKFMPGHGGFLDRFDSLLFAIPCVSILLLWFI